MQSSRLSNLMWAVTLLGLSGAATPARAQTIRVLFDASKAQMAGNADWVIDADVHNLGPNGNGIMTPGLGNDANPQAVPTPSAGGITAGTAENYWKGAISAWGVELVKLGMAVETLPYDGQITFGNVNNAQDLSNYGVFIVCEPNIPFTPAETVAILDFVQAGGGLFMVSNHINSDRNLDGWDAPQIWNELMFNNGAVGNPFGFFFNFNNNSQNSVFVDTDPQNPLTNGPAGPVDRLVFHNGCTITIDPPSNPSVRVAVWSKLCAFQFWCDGGVCRVRRGARGRARR